jgi:Mor family transcriptional regulator
MMESSEALEIIQALADGIDPSTGEVFAAESPYHHPQIIRALFTATKALEQQGQKEGRNNRTPENAGKSWDSLEDDELCQEFDGGKTINQLAQHHKRTEGSIRSRLVKLGKIQL